MDENLKKVSDITAGLMAAGLFVSADPAGCADGNETAVKAVTYNSREAGEGTAFICKGAHFKVDYLRDAIEAGSVCYITGTGYGLGSAGCPEILVSDIREAMPVIAETFYGKLSDRLELAGVTGTKGKSTTTYFLRYILDEWMEAAGKNKSAVCSGIYNYDGVIDEESHLTTPEIMELYMHMDNALRSGITHLSMEVSSQGLKYGRVAGIQFAAGAFLNIGLDHISPIEHPDFDDYFESKLKIFSHCRRACYNLDCDHQERIREASEACPYVITFSREDPSANVYGYDIRSEGGRVSLRMRLRDIEGYPDTDDEVVLGTFGTINVENALAATALAALLGVPFEYVKSGLAKSSSPGRMEVFRNADGSRIAIVDYAHNKLSYERFFETINEEFPGKKIMIVFGCPGGKGLDRRETLPRVTAEFADYAWITEEDPFMDDPMEISKEVLANLEKYGGKGEIIVDREQCIREAAARAADKTVLILAAKGRELYQHRGNEYVQIVSDAQLAEELSR